MDLDAAEPPRAGEQLHDVRARVVIVFDGDQAAWPQQRAHDVHHRTDDVEPVGSPEHGVMRIVAHFGADVGVQRHVGRVGHHQVDAAAQVRQRSRGPRRFRHERRVGGVAADDAHVAGARRSRHGPLARPQFAAGLQVAQRPAVGDPVDFDAGDVRRRHGVRDGQRQRAGSGAQIHHGGSGCFATPRGVVTHLFPEGIDAPLRHQLGFRAGHEHAGADGEFEAAHRGGADDVLQRLARGAAGHERRQLRHQRIIGRHGIAAGEN